MAMVSMKMEGDDGAVEAERTPYGYGLCLCLSEEQCEALGIKTPPAAGAKLLVQALAFVAEATQSVESDGDDEGPDVRLRLQITDMELAPALSGDAASILYPSSAQN